MGALKDYYVSHQRSGPDWVGDVDAIPKPVRVATEQQKQQYCQSEINLTEDAIAWYAKHQGTDCK